MPVCINIKFIKAEQKKMDKKGHILKCRLDNNYYYYVKVFPTQQENLFNCKRMMLFIDTNFKNVFFSRSNKEYIRFCLPTKLFIKLVYRLGGYNTV